MKSLQKAFDLLEYVVLQNGENVTPTRAATALGINPVTCTRIMGELVRRGYLVQVSRKEGYVPGPMIVSLATRRNHFERLAAAAQGPVERLSEQLQCQVNLAVLHRERRIMLCYAFSDREMKPWNRFSFTDQWETATGRLLLAALDDCEARKLAAGAGIQPFPEKELEKIRRDGYVRFVQEPLTVIGRWIRIPGYPAAAFGFGVPPEKAEQAFTVSAAAAGEISRSLERPNQPY